MFRNVKVQMLALLAAGALLGYAAASGKLSFFQKVEAAPPVIEAAALAPGQAAAKEEAIAFFVFLPGDAILEIDGDKTTSTGEYRTFRTPPLAVGGRYTYTLKATAKGKEVTRQIHISHGKDNTFDLRGD